MTQAVLRVPDISCEHCEHTIVSALPPLQGVELVVVDIEAKEVHVTFDDDRIGLDQVRAVLEQEDYPVDSIA